MSTTTPRTGDPGDDPTDSTRAPVPDEYSTEPSPPPPGAERKEGAVLLGKYQILRRLGAGGEAEVWLCEYLGMGVRVAVKVVRGLGRLDPAEMRRIRKGFQLVHELHHPHIAAIKFIEQDPDTGEMFLILEYVDGVSLGKHLAQRQGALPWAETLGLLRQIAQGLDYAHSRGVVHRDIKLENVMITPRGEVKILDFGIASAIHESLSRISNPRLLFQGTPRFMAPEQWLGEPQSGRTDQYALAMTAVLLLTGRAPFQDMASSTALREAHLSVLPAQPTGVSAAAWAVFLKAMAKKAADRHETCAAFVHALEAAERKESVPLRATPVSPARRTTAWMTAGTGLAALLVAGVFLRDRGGDPATPHVERIPESQPAGVKHPESPVPPAITEAPAALPPAPEPPLPPPAPAVAPPARPAVCETLAQEDIGKITAAGPHRSESQFPLKKLRDLAVLGGERTNSPSATLAVLLAALLHEQSRGRLHPDQFATQVMMAHALEHLARLQAQPSFVETLAQEGNLLDPFMKVVKPVDMGGHPLSIGPQADFAALNATWRGSVEAFRDIEVTELSGSNPQHITWAAEPEISYAVYARQRGAWAPVWMLQTNGLARISTVTGRASFALAGGSGMEFRVLETRDPGFVARPAWTWREDVEAPDALKPKPLAGLWRLEWTPIPGRSYACQYTLPEDGQFEPRTVPGAPTPVPGSRRVTLEHRLPAGATPSYTLSIRGKTGSGAVH